MAITLVGAAGVAYDGGNGPRNLDVPVPSGAQQKDVAVVQAFYYSEFGVPTLSVPLALRVRAGGTSGGDPMHVWAGAFTSAPPSAVTLTTKTPSGNAAPGVRIFISVWRGVDPVNPVLQVIPGANGSLVGNAATTPTIPAFTAAGSTVAVGMVMVANENIVVTPASPWTLLTRGPTGFMNNPQSGAMAYRDVQADTNYPASVWTVSGGSNDFHAAAALLLKAATAGNPIRMML